MITTLEIVDLVWQHLNGSAIKSLINGGIYKTKRPAGSSNEDVIINSLPINNLQLQSAVVNVNVYAPDIAIKVGGIEESAPNHVRLKELGGVAINELKETWSAG